MYLAFLVLWLRSNIGYDFRLAVVGTCVDIMDSFVVDGGTLITFHMHTELQYFGPQIRRDYPLNLSILLSGGKETNQDSLSSGERSGMRPR